MLLTESHVCSCGRMATVSTDGTAAICSTCDPPASRPLNRVAELLFLVRVFTWDEKPKP